MKPFSFQKSARSALHDWITKIFIIQLVNTVFSIYCPMFTKFIQYEDVHGTFFFENQPDLHVQCKIVYHIYLAVFCL